MFFYTSCFLWFAYLFWNMKHARMIKRSWFSIICRVVATTLIAGPGATIGLLWLWREETVAHKRHWAAVTEESLESERDVIG